MPDGGSCFRLWAPAAASVELLLSRPGAPALSLPRPPGPDPEPGWFRVPVAESIATLAGSRYAFRIDDRLTVPDPASRWNPDDVRGRSAIVDESAFEWQSTRWTGLPWSRIVIHELHVGCFTQGGTFRAAIDRLDELAELGITAIELMPVAEFPGQRNWGYDGVLPFAPDARYGTPDDLRRLVDAAHARGIAVFLDVVYNHFGPDGNYLGSYAPGFFTDRHRTPWGSAIDLDGPGSAPVRRFFVENALHWIDAYRLDGLRFDAVHALHDASPTHLIAEIARAIRRHLATAPGPARQVHLILENDRNQATLLRRTVDGSPAIATAQWNDDIHHALHVLVTGETDGYYDRFAEAPARRLADGLAHGFIDRGQPPADPGDAPRGEPTDGLPPTAFVNFLQNHDQIGNRAFGERIHALAPEAAVRAALACVLLGPAIPLVFMGDAFASSAPFLYFCDASGELAAAIRDGRRREFARFGRFADPAQRDRIPDPCDPATFRRSILDWSEAGAGAHARMRSFYRRALAARRQHVIPLLDGTAACHADVRLLADRAFAVCWRFERGSLTLAANFDPARSVPCPGPDGTAVFSARDGGGSRGSPLEPFDVVVSA